MLKKLDFITPTLLKVLYLFHEDPMQELHEREVMRRTGVSEGSANKILRQLSEIKVLERSKKGRMVFYKLDMKNPVTRQFKVLFNVYSLNEMIEEIKQDCRRIILFGSCSEGTDTEESDIDLYIETPSKKDISLEKFEDKLKRKIQVFRHKNIKEISNPHMANNIINGITLNNYIEVFK